MLSLRIHHVLWYRCPNALILRLWPVRIHANAHGKVFPRVRTGRQARGSTVLNISKATPDH